MAPQGKNQVRLDCIADYCPLEGMPVNWQYCATCRYNPEKYYQSCFGQVPCFHPEAYHDPHFENLLAAGPDIIAIRLLQRGIK